MFRCTATYMDMLALSHYYYYYYYYKVTLFECNVSTVLSLIVGLKILT